METAAQSRLRLLLVVCLLASVVALIPPTTPAAAQGMCFPETGKCISGLFAQYWLANGGLRQQGYPITDVFDEVNPTDGKTYPTQYFERARFEHHPENAGTPFEVLLGLLGREQYLAKYPDGRPPGGTGEVCFDVTRRCVRGIFYRYWQDNGGLRQQGFPLSDEFDEVNPTDGKTYRVQYFERARFEYHPENAGTSFEVLLGLLGREQYLAKYPRRVTFALPEFAMSGGSAMLLRSTPPATPPTLTEAELINSSGDVPIGTLEAGRDLPMDSLTLPAGTYRVTWRQRQVLFINEDGEEFASSRTDLRKMPRDVSPPETIITLKDVCYSWHFVQVCTTPAPGDALEGSEMSAMQRRMEGAVQELVSRGRLGSDDINDDGLVPDVAGEAAMERQEASVLAAPLKRTPSDLTDVKSDLLIGALSVLEPVVLDGVRVPAGAYAVRVARTNSGWTARLVAPDGGSIDVPALEREVRGQIPGQTEEPVAIVYKFCFFRWCVPQGR